MADVAFAAFSGEDPGPGGPRRIVPDVLRMAAIQIGHPVQFLVLMEGCDTACQRGLDPFLNVMVMSAVVEFGRGSVRVPAS
jgi:hypothetical protein